MIDRPGFTRVDHLSVILPPLIRTAAISTRSAILGVGARRLGVDHDELVVGLDLGDEVEDRLGAGLDVRICLALPTSFWSSSCRSMIGWSERWPNRIASAMTSSVRSLTPASTIMIASRVPETIRSSSESTSWVVVGFDDELAVDAADPNGRDRAEERDLADREGRRRGDRAEDVGVVLLVRREDRDDALDVILVALGEQRPDRPVGEAGGQDGRFGRSRLALDEAAGDLAGCVHPLLEIDGEREEVETRTGLGAIGGPQDEGVAVTDRDGAACEASDTTRSRWSACDHRTASLACETRMKNLLSREEERADGSGTGSAWRLTRRDPDSPGPR